MKTPNGGLHLYFRQPNGEALGNGRGSLPPGIDVRGAGGFVIGPGARLPDGRGWTAVPGRAAINDAPPLPQWLAAILRPPQREEAREPNNTETSDDRGRAYAMAALNGVEAELAAAPAGERNERLYKTAFRLATMAARGWLMESEIIETLVRACEGNQYLREHGHRATMKTIESGHARRPQRAARRPRGSRRRRRACGQPASGADHQEQEQQKQQGAHSSGSASTGEWDDPDMSILDDRRGELPDLPIEVFPQSHAPLDARCGARRRRHRRSHRAAADRHSLRPDRRGAPGAGHPLVAATDDVLDLPGRPVGLGQDAVARRGQARAVGGGAQPATGEHRAPIGARDARRARQGGAQEMEGRRCRRGRCRAAAAGQAGRGAGRAPVRGAAPLRLRLHDRAAGAAARGAAARCDLCGRRTRPAVS